MFSMVHNSVDPITCNISSCMNAIPKKVKIGRFEVNRLGYGAMRLTGKGVWGEPSDPATAKKVLQRAVELGVNFIDTADVYGPEVSERIIGETLAPYKPGLVIATKSGVANAGPNGPPPWPAIGRPVYIFQQVELSLRRLKTDALDLWQLHAIDPTVPVEETLGAAVKLQQQGKIKDIGLSNVTVADIERASKVVKIVSVQNLYNISNRQHEDVVDYCEKKGIAFLPWFPVGGGALVQPGGKLDTAVKKHGASLSQISIAWLLHRSPVMLPIPGTSSLKHLEENMKAADITLSDTEWAEIEVDAR
jgi:aryl-alcohol dehydrogenase-like predicted oxidoreductase